ncbi:hypothetical protein [Bacillus pumilus]|uniref:hypothetical protein n=1 Tax=Bacillus pumilus TaxID=1408 RepID=UPI0011E8BADF|nr:hypothetical protein [Bacillus pumilus]TYS40512.1 hypothetical protein FZC68_17030 [Bacillus pumilus]
MTKQANINTTTQYKTEKRDANVGEFILITNNSKTPNPSYKDGDVVIVESIAPYGVYGPGNKGIIWAADYEVIIQKYTPTPDLNHMDLESLISLSGQVMARIRELYNRALSPEFNAVGTVIGRVSSNGLSFKVDTRSDQQKRDDIVEKAKGFIESISLNDVNDNGVLYSHEFIVNAEKRTIAALRRSPGTTKIHSKGVAKCSPNDCFNAHIGKAIALLRALGLEVPYEFLNVPKPTEVRVGDVVEYRGVFGGLKVTTIVPDTQYVSAPNNEAALSSYASEKGRIIDDSRTHLSQEKSPDLGKVTMKLETHELNRSPVQLQREQIVERAKDDFKKLSTTYRPGCPSTEGFRAAFSPRTESVEVYVNREKRTVTVLITYKSSLDRKKRVSFRGIAKCMPTECFNVHIGKAIALRRALGMTVPSEYLHAPQPTEVRAGDIIECKSYYGNRIKFTVERVEKGRAYKVDGNYVRLDGGHYHGGFVTNPKTVDDSQEF